MTESIRVDAGLKRIKINDDPDRILEFNPLDVLFAEKFYALIDTFEEKNKELMGRLAGLEVHEEKDKHGLPERTPERIELINEMIDFLYENIDDLFGEGTSQLVFEDARNLDMIRQFFEGLMPFIQEAREEQIKKYVPESSQS